MTTDRKIFGTVSRHRSLTGPGDGGFTLVEILIALAVFGIILTGFFSAYLSQLKHTTYETRGAESEIELGIAKGVLQRDLELAGYGLADDYIAVTSKTFAPLAAWGNDGGTDNPDDLILAGTALSLKNRATQEWTYMSDSGPDFHVWDDVRQDVVPDDRVILMEPSSKTLLAEGGEWLFQYNGSDAAPTAVTGGAAFSKDSVGTLAYALYGAPSGGDEATQPYWTVRYYIGSGETPLGCADKSNSLLRAETDQFDTPKPDHGDPLLACVLDMEIAFGLDTDGDGAIDTWDDGAKTSKDYAEETLRKRLKEVKLYLLVQSGSRDKDYTFPLASIPVGETLEGTTVGRSVTLTAEQRHYRWRMVTLTKTLRNLR